MLASGKELRPQDHDHQGAVLADLEKLLAVVEVMVIRLLEARQRDRPCTIAPKNHSLWKQIAGGNRHDGLSAASSSAQPLQPEKP